MATTSTRWAFTLPDPADTVDITQLNNDLIKIDGGLGFTPCTLSTRPSSPVDGQAIYERDTHNAYVWDAQVSTWRAVSNATGAASGSGGGTTTTTADGVFNAGNSGTAFTLNLANGPAQTVTLTGNCTFTLTGATAGQVSSFELILTQDGTGGRTATWPASVKWSGGTPTLSSTSAAVDRIVLTSYDGGVTWYGDLVGTGYV